MTLSFAGDGGGREMGNVCVWGGGGVRGAVFSLVNATLTVNVQYP